MGDHPMQKEMLLLKMKRTESEASYAALGFKPASLQFSVEMKKKNTQQTTATKNQQPGIFLVCDIFIRGMLINILNSYINLLDWKRVL